YQSFDPIEKFKADNPPEMRSAAPGGRIRQIESYSLGAIPNQPLSLQAGKFEKYGRYQSIIGLGVGVGASIGLAGYDVYQTGKYAITDPIGFTTSFFKPQTYKDMYSHFMKDPVRGTTGLWLGGKATGGISKAVKKRVYTGTEYKLFETSPVKYKEKIRTSDYVKSTAKSGLRIEATKYQYFDFRTKFGGKLLKYELKDYGKAPAVSKKYTDVGSRIDLEISSKGEIGGIFKQTPYLKDVTRPKRQLHQVGGDIRSISGKGDIRAFVETRSRYVGKGGKDVFRRKGTESIVNMEKISKYTEYAPYQKQ
ncbi:MAG TPA: hypothetical protein DCS66_14955, partial [Flavobacteriaceae bacterium]|nr:hypothetical protein [Flavobacteriaceae bacterium]